MRYDLLVGLRLSSSLLSDRNPVKFVDVARWWFARESVRSAAAFVVFDGMESRSFVAFATAPCVALIPRRFTDVAAESACGQTQDRGCGGLTMTRMVIWI